MGPEGHAIISEVEDEFEIEVSDHDAARSGTVGQLADAVHARLRQNPEDPCPSPHGFYVIRKQLMGRLGLPRSAVRPDTLPALAFLVTISLVPLHLSWLGILLALGVARLADRLTASFKTEFPHDVYRVGDLIRFVATLDSKVWSREEVLERVRNLTVEELGLHPDQVTLEARWWTPAPA